MSNRYTSTTLETASLVTGNEALTYPAQIQGCLMDNYSSSAGWFQFFDGYAAPAGGSVPLASLRVGATSQISLDLRPSSNGIKVIERFQVGIVIVLSSTGNTYTAVSDEQFVTCWWDTSF